MGESVVNTGAFHEALNMAGLWKLPVVYIIENNRYGMGTALERASAIHDIYQRGAAYDMPRDAGRRAGRARRACGRCRSGRSRADANRSPRCSRSARTASWGTRCPTRSAARIAPRQELEEYMKRDPIQVLRAVHAGAGRDRRRRDDQAGRRGEGRRCRTPGTSPRRAPSRRSRACGKTSWWRRRHERPPWSAHASDAPLVSVVSSLVPRGTMPSSPTATP